MVMFTFYYNTYFRSSTSRNFETSMQNLLKDQHNVVLFTFPEEAILFTEFCKTEKSSRLGNFSINMNFTNIIQNLLLGQQKVANILI